MSTLFAANMAILKHRYPELLPRIADLSPQGEKPDGSLPPNLRFRGVWLHDQTNPGSECAQHFTTLPPEKPGVAIMIGMGLGHSAIRLITERPMVSHFFVFERHPEVFLEAMHRMDLRPLLEDERVHFILGVPEDLEKQLKVAVKALRLENIYTLLHPPSFQADPEGYETLKMAVFEEVNQFNISGATLMHHGMKFFENRMTLLPLLRRHRLLQELRSAFKDTPAILIAGGPSLNEDVHKLSRFTDRALLFAADTALPLLARHRIAPHFVTALDYEPITYEKIAETAPFMADKTSLISMPFVSPKIPKAFPFKEIFWAFTAGNMERWLNITAGGSLENGGAGSVAHLNMIAAITFGCSPIIMVGQDLAYTEMQDHAEDVVISNAKEMKRLLASSDRFVVDTNDGKTALSDRRFFNFKTTFESMIAANPGHYLNATRKGAVIEGAKPTDLDTVFQEHCQTSFDVNRSVETTLAASTRKQDGSIPEKDLRKKLKTITRMKKILHEAIRDGQTALKETKALIAQGKTFKSLGTLPPKLHRRITAIDKLHNQADKEDIWTLIDDLTLNGLKSTERMQLEISRLARTGPFLEWLSLTISRLNTVGEVRLHWISFLETHIQKALSAMTRDPLFHPQTAPRTEDALRTYLDTGNYRLGIPLLSGEKDSLETPEALVFQGITAALHTEYEKADACFAKVAGTGREQDVAAFRQNWGDEYAEFALWGQEFDPKLALRMLIKGYRMAPEHPELHRILSRIFRLHLPGMQEDTDTPDNLREHWENWISESPQLLDLLPDIEVAAFLFSAAQKELAAGHPEQARPLLTIAADRHQDPEILIALVDLCFARNDFSDGLHYLRMAVSKKADLATKWEEVGDRLMANAQPEPALAAYMEGFSALPSHKDFLLKTGNALLAAGAPEKAREYLNEYKTRMETDPIGSPDPSPLDQAKSLLGKGEGEAALSLLAGIQTQFASDAVFWNLFGSACRLTGRVQDAERCFREACTIDPAYAEALFHLGLLFHEHGHTEPAAKAYQKALQADPKMVTAQNNLGSLSFDRGDFETAAHLFEKAIDINPLYPDAHFNFAKSMERLGQKEKALRAYRMTMDLAPHHPFAKEARNRLQENAGTEI